MSGSITVSSLRHIRAQDLAAELLSDTRSRVAVVDVRDNDYIGGHIKGSVHAPCNQFDARLPELLRTLHGKRRVVFHCMLSQQRGPWSALRYARAKAEQATKEEEEEDQAVEAARESVVTRKVDGATADDNDTDDNDQGNRYGPPVKMIGGQEICVLEGGFQQWQSRYGTDEALTEGYVKELWESAFA